MVTEALGVKTEPFRKQQEDFAALFVRSFREAELSELRGSVSRLRNDNSELEAVVTRLNTENTRLRSVITNLRSEKGKAIVFTSVKLLLSNVITAGLAGFFLLSLFLQAFQGVLNVHWSTYAWGLVASLGLLGETLLLTYESAKLKC